MGPIQTIFVYFRPFLNIMTKIVQNLNINENSFDDLVGIQTRGCRMVVTEESAELWMVWKGALEWNYNMCAVCGQSYKASMIVIYDSRVVPDLKIPNITTQES